MRARFVALVVAVVALGLAVLAAALSAEPLYFAKSERQLGVLSADRTRLWVFEPGASLTDVLRTDLARGVCGGAPVQGADAQVEDGAMFRCGRKVFRLQELRGRPGKPKLKLEDLTNPETIKASRAYWEKVLSTPRVYPFEPVQILGDGVDEALVWAYTFVTNHWGELHPFNTWPSGETGIFHLGTGERLSRTGQKPDGASLADDQPVTIGLAADWGSGTMEADYVSQLIAQWAPDYTIHVGDVYLLGTSDEVASNCLGQVPPNATVGVSWPRGTIRSFALSGNHEMYSRGYGYYDLFLPALDQAASYFMLENEYWRVIGLDTGYTSYSVLLDAKDQPQRPEVIDWLTNVVNISNPDDTRGIVFLSHHQYRSAFENPHNATATQLAALLPPDRQVVWLWGHEHRLAIYEVGGNDGIPLNVWGRCVGVGGFPTALSGVPPDAKSSGLEAYDDRVYSVVEGLFDIPTGFNGFSQLTFNGANMTIEYRSLQLDENGSLSNTNSTLLMTETFFADPDTGSVERLEFVVNDPAITVVQGP